MKNKILETAVTFDDVLLVPGKSNVLPREVILKTRLTKNIELNIPLLSAAMDTVTEEQMAIAMAREGGIGIIHKNLSIEKQAVEVDKVKRSESGMIQNPITLTPDKKIRDALSAMEKYRVSGIPIISHNGKLVGILTNRDLRFDINEDEFIGNLMTKDNLITAPVGTDLTKAEIILQKYRIEKLPIVDKKGFLKGLITFKDIQKRKSFPSASKDKFGRLCVGAAVSIASDTLDRVDELVRNHVDVIVVDTAHGHSKGVLSMVKKINRNMVILI